MNKSTPRLLAMLIILPMLLLGWLGVRLQLDQQTVLNYQQAQLAESQLQGIDQQFQNHFLLLQSALTPQAEQLFSETGGAYDAVTVRQYIQRSPQVRQLFVITDRGQQLFPPVDQPVNRAEQQFVSQLQPILMNPERFFIASTADESAIAAEAGVTSIAADSNLYSAPLKSRSVVAEQSIASSPRGWIAWYADTGLKHIFWWQDPQGNRVGFALNSARLLSDLINLLPDSETAGTETVFDLQLQDDRGEIAYSWGDYEYEVGQKPLQIRPLSHPLGSWRLVYFSPVSDAGSGGWLGLIALLAVVLAALSGLGYLLYREHTRELRLAEQRVNFVNQVSHELKTPLTNVRLYAEMLQEEIDDDEVLSVAQRYLRVINTEAQRLSRLIENVLSFSRVKRQTNRIDLQAGVVDRCIDQVVEAYAPLFADQGITVNRQLDAGLNCRFDHGILEQVLNNLLSNCEKYAAEGKQITITSWQQQDAQINSYIRVQDNGPGVPVDQAELIFQPFYRISNKLTDGVSGTGIGLGLARDLARSHGGDLTLETESTTGASFLLWLPSPIPVCTGLE
ncbi:MAG: HAMP domain-containing histidine kinase [Amphritea sp.]|nr:HAMP domain-containing histidine kinase [Amphritea sp.]